MLWMLTPGCCHTVDRTAQTDEEGAHQAEVDGWSHFIPEEMRVKPGPCFIFPRCSPTHYLIVDGSALLCKKAPTTLCMYKQYATMSDRPACGRGENTWGSVQKKKNKKNQQEDVPKSCFHKFWTKKKPTHRQADGWCWLPLTSCPCFSDPHQHVCTPDQRTWARCPAGRGPDRPSRAPWQSGCELITDSKHVGPKLIQIHTFKSGERGSTHASLSTGPQSPHSSPRQWNLHNSLSTGRTSTRLWRWLMSPPDPPEEPPSCERT